jgi:anti-sigma regulatory factor (Ser/Thr protein kinase)
MAEEGRARTRKAESTTFLEARAASVLDFEEFVVGLEFLSESERDRLKLAGGEILDNIVKHAAPVEKGEIVVRAARRRDAPFLGFFFRSSGFAAFAASSASELATKPLFDPAHRRWRGIGLVMCRNLARRVVFRPGDTMDRIFLEFDRAELDRELPSQ